LLTRNTDKVIPIHPSKLCLQWDKKRAPLIVKTTRLSWNLGCPEMALNGTQQYDAFSCKLLTT